MVKVLLDSASLDSASARPLSLLRALWQRHSSPPVPPQGAPGRSRAAWYSQSEAQPLGAPPPPRRLKRAACKVADLIALDHPGVPHPVPLDLYDPFGLFGEMDEETKVSTVE